ncbi:MAG: DUF1707 domain-containing protein [Propionibacteriaceae bacterium]|nr:DUF1707 domain-containing protein [Propionibacteriaceae bacterium]
MTDPRDLRAGNADRDAVVASLHEAVAAGRLDPEELGPRVDAARSARTFGDLDDVVADLPITPPSVSLTGQGAAGQGATDGQGLVAGQGIVGGQSQPSDSLVSRADAPVRRWPSGEPVDRGPIGESPENPLFIDAGWSSDKRQGDWVIPQFLRLRGGVGSVHLDCTEAISSHNVIHVWVEGDLGSITIVVPEGWAADAESVQKSLGSIYIKVPKEPTMGRPILVINGAMGMGSLTVRPPNWFERRKLEKKLR